MSVDHLQGRRTGRPRGSKSKSPALKGLIWAARHIGKNTAPPTEAARYWLRVAEEQPNKFAAALAELDASNKRMNGNTGQEPDLSNSWWTGSDAHKRNLDFLFRPNGEVLVAHRNNLTPGTWTMDEDQLRIDLSDAAFNGTIQENHFSGTWIYRSGQTCQFDVRKT